VSTPARILLVEDDLENNRLLKEVLQRWGYAVLDVARGADAVLLAARERFDLVLADIRMPDVDGLQVLRAFRKEQPGTPVVMMTGFGSVETAVEAINAGAFDYLSKPFKFDEIRLTLQRALDPRKPPGDGAASAPDEAHGEVRLIGHSRAMAEVYKTIAKVAAGRSTVLICGESGTGKELVARAIHRNSNRVRQPFLAINCAAMPETLLESELFGYARGSHSTATADKAGLFEAASGGTLFLDELADTSLGLQSKLLRVLEESETRRIGDARVIQVDVRIIASTNRDIPALIQEGRFRSDLYYRLNVVTIALPPLRERREDIPALADVFIHKYNAVAHKSVTGIAPEVLDRFERYSWPGNVRELENVIERAVLMNQKSVIMLEDLPPTLQEAPNAATSLSLQEIERLHIIQILQQTRGNVKAAAEILGVDRKTLYRKASRYGIDIVRE
jgi:DNA-binding NtrC family response regulator